MNMWHVTRKVIIIYRSQSVRYGNPPRKSYSIEIEPHIPLALFNLTEKYNLT
jgi:hypothetical protein